MKTKILVDFARAAVAALPMVVLTVASGAAQASVVTGGTLTPMITAGAPPDSPANRVDPNTAASPFSGVVSINIRYGGSSFICSGTLVSKRDVVTAGHCVDTNGQGQLIDITQAGNDVRVVFNASSVIGSPGRAIITADRVSMNPNYQGFGKCPYATSTDFCVNDDLAVIHMNQDAPADAKIYRTHAGELDTGQLITMVGYGTSGDGVNGYTTGPSFRVKRSGQNVMDLFDRDDELLFAGGPKEVWYADFDGGGQDTFCNLFGVCTSILANDKEAGIGGGDSGGPTFMYSGGEYFLVGNNTFGGTFVGQTPGTFGTYFGGMLFSSYMDYLEFATDGAINGVPAPGSLALVGIAALCMLGAGRRRRAAAL